LAKPAATVEPNDDLVSGMITTQAFDPLAADMNGMIIDTPKLRLADLAR